MAVAEARNLTQGAADLAMQRFRRVAHHARTVKPADLPRIRLSWLDWFGADVQRTLLTNRAVELRATIAAFRYIDMARRRLEKGLRMNVVTNPVADTIHVWLERRT